MCYTESMKVFSAIILAISILGVSIFGFLGMQTMHHEANGECPVNFTGRTIPCPLRDGMFAFSLFHSNAFKSSIVSVFAPTPLAAFLFFVLLVIVIALLAIHPHALMRSTYFRSTRSLAPLTRIKEKLWFCFHERSPSFSVGA